MYPNDPVALERRQKDESDLALMKAALIVTGVPVTKSDVAMGMHRTIPPKQQHQALAIAAGALAMARADVVPLRKREPAPQRPSAPPPGPKPGTALPLAAETANYDRFRPGDALLSALGR